jgi:hypothetical protein
MQFKNFTPHTINLNDGSEFISEGIARVNSTFTPFENGVCRQVLGELTGLPEPEEGVLFIVSALCLEKAKQMGRTDCVAPASGHPEVIRVTEGERKGQIISVPGFIA